MLLSVSLEHKGTAGSTADKHNLRSCPPQTEVGFLQTAAQAQYSHFTAEAADSAASPVTGRCDIWDMRQHPPEMLLLTSAFSLLPKCQG